MLTSLGHAMYRHWRLVVLGWFAVLITGVLLGGGVFAALDPGDGMRRDVESALVEQRLSELGRDVVPDIVVLLDGRPVADPALRRAVEQLVADLRTLPGVAGAAGPGDVPDSGQVAADGLAQLVIVVLRDALSEEAKLQTVAEVRSLAAQVDVPQTVVGGRVPAQSEFKQASEADLQRAELIALPLLIVALVLVFRGLLAATVPLLVAVTSIVGALLVLLALSTLTTLSAYSVNVVTMVGLGLAVDYCLLLVSRFREERFSGHDVASSVGRTVATAGRTVMFSGLTVAIALTGLLVFTEPLLRSLAWGAIGVVALTVAVALTLVPALLAMFGRRIRPAPAPARAQNGFFARTARRVQGSARLVLLTLVVVLVVLALPFRDVVLGGSGPETLAETSPSRVLQETVAERFPGGGTSPVIVVAEIEPDSPVMDELLSTLRGFPEVAAASALPLPGAPAVIELIPVESGTGAAAQQLVERVRSAALPVPVQVSGAAATLVDFQDSVASRLPFALAVIAIATIALLFFMTGSLILPITAVVMSALSLGASFGALVWIFQDGALSGLLNFTPTGSIDTAIPLLVLVFAFGLSMDYEVFMLARIKEAFDRHGDSDRAVTEGLQRTGRIVTAAAALIVVVFLAFATGDLITIKALGVGLAIAVIVDVTLVRLLLLPAIMSILGNSAWWAPAPLRRVYRRITATPTDEPKVLVTHSGN